MSYVLDTSAILSRRFNFTSRDIIIPESVINEIRKGRLRDTISSLEGALNVLSPSKKSVETVAEASRKSGDLEALSSTDVDVVALAYETGSIIITDDYAIQNVASHLGVEYQGANISEIANEVIWKFRCTGCRKIFSSPVESCPVCGHEVVRTRRGAKSRSKRPEVEK